MRKEEGWATGQQPVHVKLPIATETTNKCNTAEKGKSSSSVVTGSLILDPNFLTKEHHAYQDLERAHDKPDWASRPASPGI
ncbi:hypothetical protein Aduo_009391 [Ancylostoma duodenale]